MIDKSTIIRKPKIIIIIFGIISFIRIKIIGTFSPFELLAILFFLYQKVSNSNLKIEIFENKIYKSFTNLLILWSFCQLFSDILNKTIISSSLKGVLAPLLIILSLRLLLILKKFFDYKYFIEDFIIGMGLCQIYYNFFNPSNIQTSIKFGLLFNICLVLFSLLKNQKINLILNLLFIFIYINYNVRSFLIIHIIFLISKLFGKENLINTINYKLFFNIRNGIFKYFIIIVLLLLLSPFTRNINNFFIKIRPDDQRVNILKSQSKGNLFSARLEYYSFFDSFKDAPILGHGSWPYDFNYKYYLISQRGDPDTNKKTDRKIIEQSKQSSKTPEGIPYIPSHSFIQQNIIWAGIFASFFFFYALNLTISAISNSFINDSIRIILIKFVYDIFFSPLGFNRFYIPLACLIIITCFIYMNKKKIK